MIFYIYVGYPLVIAIMSVFKTKNIKKSNFEARVTILIAAFNEQDSIEQTILNKINLDYPNDKYEIIVVSDDSTDKTDEIVKKYEAQNVKLIRQIPRAGKTAALNLAVPEATGEILVFSDANSIYAPDALKKLVANFNDKVVGYVSGKMIYIDPDGSIIGDGCSAYMKYENMLRSLETKIGSVVGVDGGIDAVRKTLYQSMNPDQLPDFVLPLKVVQQGYRVVYEPDALLKEQSLKKTEDEYRMRVRVSLRALWALYDMRPLLSFRRFGLFSWQLWSHKVLRYLCFIFLISAFLINFMLWPASSFYQLLFIIQILFYLGAALSPFLERKGLKFKLFFFMYYFTLLNIASAYAFAKFLMRQKMVTWVPRKG